MSKHFGSCRQLIRAFEELVPSKGDTIFKEPHLPGDDVACFSRVISCLVDQATLETQLSVEYAIICQQLAEIFDPIPGEGKTVNQFKYTVTNQLQQNFVSIRKSPATFKSHDEHVKLQEEINFEEDFATRTRLRKELEARLKSRSRATGTVQLIAELFNVEFINHRVMELCMRELLGESQEPTELDIECFHILMTTTGAKLEGHPVGAKIVEKFLGRLTEIMEKDPAKYSGKTRSSMLEVFQLRANGWKPPTKPEAAPESRPEPPKAVVKAAPKINKLLQEVKVSRILFKELNDVLHHLGPGEMIQFVHQFRKIKFQSEEQLQGAVKIVFERVMAASNWLSLLALVCKGLAVATAPAEGNNNNTVTFGRLLLSLIEQEIETQQQNSRIFRQICEKTKTLKSVRNAKKAHQMKEEIENDFKLQARAHRFTVFVGELFKADMVKSHFIFEYIAKLLHPETISSTSVESFCLLIHSTDRKLLQGRNEVDLLKHNIASLSEAMETVQLSWRALHMVKDLLDKCRVYFQILSNAGLTNEFSGFSRCELPWNSTFSEDVLWQEEMNETHVLVPIQQTNGIGEGVKPPPGSPPLNLIHRLPPPTFSPPPNQQNEENLGPQQNYKRGSMTEAASYNDLVPVDFSKDRVNPSMIKKSRKKSPQN